MAAQDNIQNTRPNRNSPTIGGLPNAAENIDPGAPSTLYPPGTYRDLYNPVNWNAPADNVLNTCMLTSIPEGGSLVWFFDPDPHTVVWDLAMQNQINPTRGGQVTYPRYRTIGPLLIAGQMRTRYDLIQFSFFVAAHMQECIEKGPALHFIYPERDIDFICYVRQLPRVGLVAQEGDMVPQYQVILDITRDHLPLTEIPFSQLGIPANVGWVNVQQAAQIAEGLFPGLNISGLEHGAAQNQGLNSQGQAPGSSSPGSTQGGGGTTNRDRNGNGTDFSNPNNLTPQNLINAGANELSKLGGDLASLFPF